LITIVLSPAIEASFTVLMHPGLLDVIAAMVLARAIFGMTRRYFLWAYHVCVQ